MWFNFYAACHLPKKNVLPVFSFPAHLLSQAVQHLLQSRSVQLQRDGEQLLSKAEDQRLQLGHVAQQLPGSAALVLGVRKGAGGRCRRKTVTVLKCKYRTEVLVFFYCITFT